MTAPSLAPIRFDTRLGVREVPVEVLRVMAIGVQAHMNRWPKWRYQNKGAPILKDHRQWLGDDIVTMLLRPHDFAAILLKILTKQNGDTIRRITLRWRPDEFGSKPWICESNDSFYREDILAQAEVEKKVASSISPTFPVQRVSDEAVATAVSIAKSALLNSPNVQRLIKDEAGA